MPALDDLSAPTRIASYLAALAVVFAAATGVGAAVGPIKAPASSPSHNTDHPAITDSDPAQPHEGAHTP
jgi:hypothetical protein